MSKKYLDDNGLLYFWQKLKSYFTKKSDAVKTITRSGTTFTATMADGTTTFTFDQQDNSVDPSTTTPAMDGTAAVGTETAYARGDHVHPSDTSRVPTTRTVNGHALSANVTVTASDIGLGNVDNTADANKAVLSATKLATARNIDGIAFDGSAAIHHYGTCSTAAATAAKVATVTGGTFTLATGAIVFVKMTYANTASSPTLNVNSTGAKSIMRYGTTAPSTSAATSWQAGSVVGFIYDGTYWQMIGWLNDDTTYSNASLGQVYGTCETDNSDKEKVVTIGNYTLTVGGIVSVKFTYAVTSYATLNIDSKGAKDIYYNGTAIANGVIGAYDTATFIYDGTRYHLIAIDTAISNIIGTSPISVTRSGKKVTLSHASSGVTAASKGDSSAQTPAFGGTFKALSGTVNATGHLTSFEEHTVTIPSTEATTSAAGLMSASDKTKVDKLVFDSNNLIDSSILPSYVDDVIEAYPVSSATELSSTWLASGSASGTVITPETGKIYVLMEDSTSYAANTQFRWSGSAYVKLADGGVSEITNSEIDTIVAS